MTLFRSDVKKEQAKQKLEKEEQEKLILTKIKRVEEQNNQTTRLEKILSGSDRISGAINQL